MFFDLLVLFIVLTVIFLLLSIFTMEDYPMMAIPFVMCGMIFSIICTYGLWNIETPYTGYNASWGNTSMGLYANTSYGDPYGYIFMFLFFLFVMIFVRIGWNLLDESLKTKGQMKYNKRYNRR